MGYNDKVTTLWVLWHVHAIFIILSRSPLTPHPHPHPIKTYTTLVPTVAKKEVIFHGEAWIREIKKKG